MPKIISERFIYILLFIFPLFVARQWFLPGLPQTHDAETHVSRAAVFSKSILEGNIFPRWAGPLNWRYGTPSIMFLYPGLSYFSALIHLATKMQFINIFKLLIVSGYIGSGIFWYRWMRALGFWLFPALVSSLFYLLAPYRLVNIFVRGVLGEHVGFFFFPLIMLMATRLWRTGKTLYSSGLALSVAGLILSHNLSALMYLPLVVVYPIVLIGIYREKPIQLKIYFGSIGLGLLLSALFWLPAILESKYTLASWMVGAQQGYTTNFLAFRQLIWSPWGYGWSEPGIDRDGMSFQVGIVQWLVLLAGIGLLIKFSKQELLLLKFGLALVIAGIFLSLPISLPLWRWISLLQKFQFPWRFLSLIVIGSSLMAAIVADKFKHSKIISLALLISPIMFTIGYWKIAGPSTLSEQFLAVDYVGTSDTGETTPVWAIRFQEKFPKAPIEIVSAEGTVEIKNLNKLIQKHEFEISATAASRIVDNTLYFPGWKVYVDGVETPIGYQDENWRGLITFPVPAGEHSIKVVFEETRIRKFADALSMISVGILLGLFIKKQNYVYNN